MNIKPCPCCKLPLTTKNTKYNGRMDGIMYFTCNACHSTTVLIAKALRKVLNMKPLREAA